MSITSKVDGVLEITQCDTAAEFLDYLQIRKQIWLPQKASASPWVFRGQSDAKWSLKPKALRTKKEDGNSKKWLDSCRIKYEPVVDELLNKYPDSQYLTGYGSQRTKELILQSIAELVAMQEFIDLADHVGHPIPESSGMLISGSKLPNIDNIDDELRSGPQRYFYLYTSTSINLALAQHHGIPTRLLDWTQLPFAAAFFAAEEAINNEPNQRIAVWAINSDAIDDALNHKPTTELRKTTQRRGKISYLHAQGGLFIYDGLANKHYLENGYWRSFEEVVASNSNNSTAPILRKIDLPATQSAELLRLLSAENVTRAHLMPTYDNITATLKLEHEIKEFLE